MKKRLQGFVAGVLACSIIGAGAYASQQVRIVIDGKELIPVDVNGNRVDPILVDGTTYLPVRAVANAFGKAVYWDGPNWTVYLGEMKGMLEYPTVQIENMISIADNVTKTDKLTDNYGNSYDHAIENGNIEMQYLCNMQYSRFKGTLYIPQGEKSEYSTYLTIIADGKTIYTSPEMNKTSAPVEIDVNITGYNDIQIKFSNNGYFERLSICLGNAGFYQ